MHKTRGWWRLGLILLFLLVACEGYSQSGVKTVENQTMTGGSRSVTIGKANGTITEDIEIGTGSLAGLVLDANVTLSVGMGSYKIELLGDDDEVTLALAAANGQTVSGQGWMATDGFGEAHYRVTAVEAEDVSYTIEYTFR